jgi:hypothetical protein
VQVVLQRARAYWGKQPWMTALREDIATILDKHGGVATTEELTRAVLAARGSTADEPRRSRLATAVAYAALETEMVRENARYLRYRGQSHVFALATSSLAEYYRGSPAARAQYAERLGLKADDLAAADARLTPTGIAQELQTELPPEGDPALPASCRLEDSGALQPSRAVSAPDVGASRLEAGSWFIAGSEIPDDPAGAPAHCQPLSRSGADPGPARTR